MYIFIDVANVWSIQKSMRKMLNYTALPKTAQKIIARKTGSMVETQQVFYYEAYPLENTRKYSTNGTHKFMKWLQKSLRFIIRKKPIKQVKAYPPTLRSGHWPCFKLRLSSLRSDCLHPSGLRPGY